MSKDKTPMVKDTKAKTSKVKVTTAKEDKAPKAKGPAAPKAKVSKAPKEKVVKTKKVKENLVVGQTPEKLAEQLLNAKKELFNLRCQKVLGELNDTSRFKKLRKLVAQVKTELTKRLKRSA